MPFGRIVAALCTLLALTETAIAAAASADVEIHVSDAASREPVRLARVLLVGGKTYAGYTDASGAATFAGVDEGQYRATVSHAGFTRIGSEPFDVSAGRRVLIDVALARVVGPKVIGRVQTRSIPRLDTTTIASGSVQEKLGGGSLAQALGGFSEFSIGVGGFSIDGHDPRETEVSIDGVPAGGAGSTGLDLRGLNLDLFSSASSSSTSQNVAGGTVALTTLEPTLAFQTSTTMSYGSDERTNLRFWARGTSGRIGYVYGHAAGGVNGPIDNLTYADASGLDYLHRSGSSARGDLAKIRIPLSVASAFTATFVSSRAAADIVCERFVGPLPCGFGPNNESVSRSSLAIGKLVFNGASSDGLLSVVRATGDSSEDLTRRLINGTPAPAQTSSHSVSESVFGSLNLRGDLTTMSLVVSAGRARFDQRIIGPFSVAGGGSVSNVNATLRYERQFSERLLAFAALTAMKDGLDKPLGVSSGVSWRPNAADSFSGSVSLRNGGGTLISQGTLRDPASLVYDCPGHAVFAKALGDPATPSSVSDVRASWQHRRAGWSLSGELGRQVQHNASVTTILSGEADPRDLDAAYLAAISAFYATPAGCGTTAGVPSASSVYFIEPVGGINRVYQTGRLGFSYQPTGAVTVGGYVRFSDARVFGSDPRLLNPFSVTVPGRQLPNVPRWRAGFVLDYKPRRSATELIALYQFAGTNNERNLPAFGTVAVGASFDTSHGNVTFGITNLTNAHTGTFITGAGSLPLETAGGFALPSLAQPLRPRSFSLTYAVRSGGLQRPQVGDASRIDTEQAGPSVRFGPLPSRTPENPFALDRTDPNCTPEHVASATALVNSLRAAAAQLDTIKARSGSYPETFEVVAIKGLEERLQYHKTSDSYAVAIVPQVKNVLGLACIPVNAAGDPSHATAAGAYSDPASGPRRSEFAFMPRFGIYVVFHQGTLVENLAPPSAGARPADPLALRDQCPASQRPLVLDVVGAIRQLSGSGDARTLESGVTLTPRTFKATRFVEVGFPDPLSRAIFTGCLYVRTATPDQAVLLGLPAAANGLYYNTSEGLITR